MAIHKNDKKPKNIRSRVGTLIRKPSGLYLARWIIDKTRTPQGKIKYKFHFESTGAYDYSTAQKYLSSRTIDLGFADEIRCVERLLEKRDALLYKKTIQEEKQRKESEEKENSEPAISLLEAFGYYEKSSKRPDSGRRTLSDYESQYCIFIDWVKEKYSEIRELRQITPEIADEFATHLKETRAASTHNHYIVFLRSFWKTLMQYSTSRLEKNPWEGIRNLTSDSIIKEPFTTEMIERFFPLLPENYKKLTTIALYTGMRLEDAVTLKFEQCDLNLNLIQFSPKKTKRRYNLKVYLPIHPTLRALLELTPRGERKGFILPELAEKYVREPSIITNKFQKVLIEAGIQTTVICERGVKARVRYGFHSIRHFVNTWLIDSGVPSMTVAKMMCHKAVKEAMTLRYYHENREALTRAVATLPYFEAVDSLAPVARIPSSRNCSSTEEMLKKIKRLITSLPMSARKEIADHFLNDCSAANAIIEIN